MRETKSLEIQVVNESFVNAVEKLTRTETIEKISSLSICDWGSDPLSRIPAEEVKEERVNEKYIFAFEYKSILIKFLQSIGIYVYFKYKEN